MSKPESWRLTPASYPFHSVTQTRFQDMDILGHLNNVAFAALFENGRVRFNRSMDERGKRGTGERWLVAAVSISYLREGTFPDDVDVSSGIGRIGNSSWVIEQAMFQHGHCIATCDTTIVYVNEAGPKALDDAFKGELAAMRTGA